MYKIYFKHSNKIETILPLKDYPTTLLNYRIEGDFVTFFYVIVTQNTGIETMNKFSYSTDDIAKIEYVDDNLQEERIRKIKTFYIKTSFLEKLSNFYVNMRILWKK